MTTEREGARSTGARREELTITADYNERYRLASAAPQLSVERAVFGTDYGITSFTTVSQAEKLLERLRPGASSRVLDIGTGSGWPGLYLSLRTQCEVVGCDLPLEGLRTARRRSSSDGTSSRVHLLQCSARALPFRAGSFDAIVHADVLC